MLPGAPSLSTNRVTFILKLQTLSPSCLWDLGPSPGSQPLLDSASLTSRAKVISAWPSSRGLLAPPPTAPWCLSLYPQGTFGGQYACRGGVGAAERLTSACMLLLRAGHISCALSSPFPKCIWKQILLSRENLERLMFCEMHFGILRIFWSLVKKFTGRIKKTYRSILLGGLAELRMKQPVLLPSSSSS